jgi:hypothetical protein
VYHIVRDGGATPTKTVPPLGNCTRDLSWAKLTGQNCFTNSTVKNIFPNFLEVFQAILFMEPLNKLSPRKFPRS